MGRARGEGSGMGVLRALAAAAIVGAGVASLALVAAPRADAEARLLVTGETRATGSAAPSTAAIVRSDSTDARAGHICGGTVVGAYAVLTAASCVSAAGIPVDVGSLNVVAGRDALSGTDGLRLAVARIHLDPGSDAAILHLAKGTTAPPARLATSDEDATLNRAGQRAEIAGWGANGGASDALQQAEVTLGGANPTVGVCPGDRGGPVMRANSAGARILIGVLRAGAGCGAPSPLQFTRASAIAAWAGPIIAGTVPVLPPPVQPAGTPTPTAPVNARPSVLRTYTVTVRRGRTVRLRYQVDDDGLETREVISIINPRGRLVKRIVKPMETLSQDAVYGISWRVPKTVRVGRWRYCVEAFDAEGLRDRECAFFRVRR
jgi:secreted trypsin-like serine protease